MKEKAFIDQQNTREPLWVNAFALVLLGAVSLGYVLFKRNFAELHFQLPFFGGLPLFPGEMLWVVCFALIVFKLFISGKVGKNSFFQNDGILWFWWGIIIYGIWLSAKVIFGFVNYGPLAFRHAALFYYPLFAIFGFIFFDRRLFSKKVSFFLLGIIFLFIYRKYDLYWTFTLGSLAVILILRIHSLKIRLLTGLFTLLLLPYSAFFSTARMMVVANAFSFTVLGVGLWRTLSFKKMHKIFILVLFIIGIAASALYAFFTKNSGRIFVEPKAVIEAYQSMDQDIQKYEKNYVKEPISAQLYRPEESSLSLNPRKSEISSAVLNCDNFRDEENLVKWTSINNIVFRLFIWRDMMEEWCQKKPWWGFHFGYPLRSKSLEVLSWAENEWGVLGWVEPHNSYFHILYRAGVFGIIFVSGILGLAIWLLVNAFAMRSLTAILLSAIVWNWMIAANFLITFEMPYTAIPFWTLFGMSIAYCKQLKDASIFGG